MFSKKIGGGVRFLWKRCRAFTITGTSLIALLLAVNLIILQVPLISNTFNTIFGEGPGPAVGRPRHGGVFHAHRGSGPSPTLWPRPTRSTRGSAPRASCS